VSSELGADDSALMKDLVSLNQFESEQERKVRSVMVSPKRNMELTCREKLLSNIAQLVAKFVHDVSIKQGLSEKVASEAGGRIYTSGSYRSANGSWLTGKS
jgi:poly(A) polymerase